MRQIIFALLTCLLAVPVCLRAQLTLNPNPSRMIGQARLTFSGDQMNLVEGRELNGPVAVAIDASSTPAAIYVADVGNNRVLGWRDSVNFANGATADVIVGQRDRYSTFALGPGSTLNSGLREPTSVAVDKAGRLFVLDAGNNRILRFTRPFAQPDDLKLPDLVIGQTSTAARAPNQGGVISAKTLWTVTSSGIPYATCLLFDAQGNLWVTDSGNHRVLRYPASRIGDGATNGPEADLVIGQLDFSTNTPPLQVYGQNTQLVKGKLNAPSGLAFDRAGRLFVVDDLSRVLVFAPNPQTGAEAVRVMGVLGPVPQGQPAPLPVNDTRLLNPQGILVVNNTPLVMDTGNHRIARFDPVDLWPAETTEKPSPPALAIIGQDSFTNLVARANRGKAEPGKNTLASPFQAVYYNGETFVVDSGNNRVLVFPDLSSGPSLAASAPYEARRVLGQIGFEYRSPNLTEGRELNRPQGMTVDTLSNPPILYVADTFNNRVLGFRDVRKLRPGDFADLVIGQPDFLRTVPNHPTGEADQPSPGSLLLPMSVASDAEGNLWVADSGNSRVLRFPRPLDAGRGLQRADLVIGQNDFTSRTTDATARTLGAPFGIAFTPDGHLMVSDSGHNRVMFYRKPFSNGMAATAVFGQPDFFTTAPGAETNRMNTPRHISTDTDGRFYVADQGNGRIAIYSNPVLAGSDPSPAFALRGLNNPRGAAVSALSGEIWVAESGTNRTLRYPRFDQLILGAQPNFGLNIPGGLGVAAVALDPFGNLLIADSGSRISIHFPALITTNAASGSPRLSPGMYATLKPLTGASFGEETKVFTDVAFPPMTRTLGDVQVLVADQPAPLHYVSPIQINAFIPMSSPTTGTVEIQVVRVSTGQILASYPVQMGVASPGLFSANGTGTGPLAALNQDNSLNTAGNPIARGQVIQLFGTGQGFVPGAPPDGEPASGLTPTDVRPRVIIGTDFVADSDVQYSGFAPGAVGLWQINVKIPDKVAPAAAVLVVVVHRDVPSNNPENPALIRTTIAVKQ
jgi:uncharacterized protein (TIGR03437 family)